MRIGVISDIHDHLHPLVLALEWLQTRTEVLLCCGDLCSPFVIGYLARFPGDVHIVFGNNDGDLYRITNNARPYPNLRLHGELWEGKLGDKRFAMQHFDAMARPLAASGRYDAVCFGHNHRQEVQHVGDCWLLNPGSLMGAQFDSEGAKFVNPSFLCLDTEQMEITRCEITDGLVQVLSKV